MANVIKNFLIVFTISFLIAFGAWFMYLKLWLQYDEGKEPSGKDMAKKAVLVGGIVGFVIGVIGTGVIMGRKSGRVGGYDTGGMLDIML